MRVKEVTIIISYLISLRLMNILYIVVITLLKK